MKRIAVILTICLLLAPASLAETTSPADDFISGLSQAWAGLKGMVGEATQAAAEWADDSGITEWMDGAVNDVSAWLQDFDLSAWVGNAGATISTWFESAGAWTGEAAANLQDFIEANEPAVDAWLNQAGENVKAAWETLASPQTHTQQEVLEAYETVVESLEEVEDAYSPETDELAPQDEVHNADATAQGEVGIDYLALVNKLNPLPDGWEDALETVHITNSVGDDVEVEARAYAAYERLKTDLEANDGIEIELDSARRSVAAQQDIMDRFIEKYGADYAAKTVAQPGYSEHHTGLALDLYFRLDGRDIYYNEDMVQYPEIWEKIHAKLADYGFILRYLKDKEHITGYGYEPWHIRYVDSPEIAKEIMSQPGMTLEVYLGAVNDTDPVIDYGESTLYTEEELEEAAVQAKCKFASFAGCELHSLRYAGDGCNTKENIAWLNELAEGSDYVQAVEFLSDFHTPVEGGDAWEADAEYKDWQWWLAREKDGGWQLLTWGY